MAWDASRRLPLCLDIDSSSRRKRGWSESSFAHQRSPMQTRWVAKQLQRFRDQESPHIRVSPGDRRQKTMRGEHPARCDEAGESSSQRAPHESRAMSAWMPKVGPTSRYSVAAKNNTARRSLGRRLRSSALEIRKDSAFPADAIRGYFGKCHTSIRPQNPCLNLGR